MQRPVAVALALGLLLTAATPTLAAWITGPAGERVFVRGLIYSPYHPREAWALSDATRQLDRDLLRKLDANCIITSHPTSATEVTEWHSRGIYTIPQVPFTPTEHTFFVNGNDAPVPLYASEMDRLAFREAARDLAASLKGNPGALAISLASDLNWSAYDATLGFTYGGFDNLTLDAFHTALKQRFAGREALILGGGEDEARTLSDVIPPIGIKPSGLFWEWWRFMAGTLAEYLRQADEGIRAVDCDRPSLYRAACGVTWDPGSEGLRLPFAGISAGGVFHGQATNWLRFCTTIQRLASAAAGRPVLITGTGAHTLLTEPADTMRAIRMSVACALLHPEVAGVALQEFSDQWQVAGKPNQQDDSSAREYWGLVTADRQPKPAFQTAREMFDLLDRYGVTFQEWQSPPAVYLGQQELDWWKVGGQEAGFHERVADQLYRHGVPFAFLDSAGLAKVTAAAQPRLILCDSYLPSEPDGTWPVHENLFRYVREGGNLFYITRMPWQAVYGRPPVPAEFQTPADRTPASRTCGAGKYAIYPTYDMEDSTLRPVLEDYLAGYLENRPVISIKGPGDALPVFWRVFQDRSTRWLLVVNPASSQAPPLTVELGAGVLARQARLVASDGAGCGARGKTRLGIGGLNCYALISLGPASAASPGT